MDFSFISTLEDTAPAADVAQASEMEDLIAVAKYIPLLKWTYDPSKGGPDDNGDVHMGFITQALSKVPGLASAVSVDENGIEQFDSRYVSAAALSLVAALARKVLNVSLDPNYSQEEIV